MVADFFKDTPWLRIPRNRRGEIRIEPRFPGGGLCGGSSASSEGKAKGSKLSALAAARKKRGDSRETELVSGQESIGTHADCSAKSLDTLTHKWAHESMQGYELQRGNGTEGNSRSPQNTALRGLQLKARLGGPRKDSNGSLSGQDRKSSTDTSSSEKVRDKQEVELNASPSRFATVITGHGHYDSISWKEERIPDTISLSYVPGLSITELSPFVGPSPDDIVQRAQTQRG